MSSRVHMTAGQRRGLTYVVMSVPMLMAFDFFLTRPASADFYTTVAQVIAAMYLAVALEYFTGEGVRLSSADRVEFTVLLGISWLGLLACLRGLAEGQLAEGQGGWPAGLGAAGLIASVQLVTGSLSHRVALQNPQLVGRLVYVACLAPIVIILLPQP